MKNDSKAERYVRHAKNVNHYNEITSARCPGPGPCPACGTGACALPEAEAFGPSNEPERSSSPVTRHGVISAKEA